MAIAEYANALLSIPKTLAVNAAKDSTDLVAKLRAYHNAAQSTSGEKEKQALKWWVGFERLVYIYMHALLLIQHGCSYERLGMASI